jgi:DNA polymerase-3 subunit delta'
MNGRNKESQKKFLEYFILLLEHLIRFNQIGAENLTMLDAELKLVNTLSNQGLSGYAIDLIATRMSDAIYHLERNANTKILFHSLSLHVQQIIFEHKKNLQSA